MLKMTTRGIGFAWILAFPITSCIMIPLFIVAPSTRAQGPNSSSNLGLGQVRTRACRSTRRRRMYNSTADTHVVHGCFVTSQGRTCTSHRPSTARGCSASSPCCTDLAVSGRMVDVAHAHVVVSPSVAAAVRRRVAQVFAVWSIPSADALADCVVRLVEHTGTFVTATRPAILVARSSAVAPEAGLPVARGSSSGTSSAAA
jgi:hypothetical protein